MTTPSSPTARWKYIGRSMRTSASDDTSVECPTTPGSRALTSMVRRWPPGTLMVAVTGAAFSGPKRTFTLAVDVAGVSSVRYSWKPSRVDPSANDHDRFGVLPRTEGEPFTVPSVKPREKYMERSATMGAEARTLAETPVRPRPTAELTSMVVRPRAGTVAVVSSGVEPSSEK